MLHALVVVEVTGGPHDREIGTRHLSGQSAIAVPLPSSLAKVGQVACPAECLDRHVDDESILPEDRLSCPRDRGGGEHRPERGRRGRIPWDPGHERREDRSTESGSRVGGTRADGAARERRRRRGPLSVEIDDRDQQEERDRCQRVLHRQKRTRRDRYVGACPASAERPVNTLAMSNTMLPLTSPNPTAGPPPSESPASKRYPARRCAR